VEAENRTNPHHFRPERKDPEKMTAVADRGNKGGGLTILAHEELGKVMVHRQEEGDMTMARHPEEADATMARHPEGVDTMTVHRQELGDRMMACRQEEDDPTTCHRQEVDETTMPLAQTTAAGVEMAKDCRLAVGGEGGREWVATAVQETINLEEEGGTVGEAAVTTVEHGAGIAKPNGFHVVIPCSTLISISKQF
jgi:hypothetical protein